MVIKKPATTSASVYEHWRHHLVDEARDMDENGDLTIPDIYFFEKYPDLTPKHLAAIQQLQRTHK
jgi:hypothetical protein